MWGERGRGGNEPRGAAGQRDPVQRHFQEPNAVSGISYQAVMTRHEKGIEYIFPFYLTHAITFLSYESQIEARANISPFLAMNLR